MSESITVSYQVDRADMARRGRLGALVKHSRHDPSEDMAKARAAFNQRFLDEVDPKRELPEGERERRASYARKLYYTRLAQASAAARKNRKKTAG